MTKRGKGKTWTWYFNNAVGESFAVHASAWLDESGVPHESHRVIKAVTGGVVGTFNNPADAYRAMGHNSSIV